MNTLLPRKSVFLVASMVILIMVSTLVARIPVPLQAKEAVTDPRVVRISAKTDIDRQRLASSGIDLLEQRAGDQLFALVTSAQQRKLSAEGWKVTIDQQQTAQLNDWLANPTVFREGYRTVEETDDLLKASAAAYPSLATLVDYGDSWEKLQSGGERGYDLRAIRLSNKAVAGPKPVFVLLAALHPREIATSELATRYMTHLLDGYGREADTTWLLDEHEVVIIPIANPDGRKIVEQGYLQRKNTNPGSQQCITPPTINNQIGVDLNRNFSFVWGTINEPNTPPCSETFPGVAAASEPETQALQTFLQTLFPDQRPPHADAAAISEASGVMISLHSFSNLVLWPWGYSADGAPNKTALERLGVKLASFNGYRPQQSFDLYPTSGTTEDWLYGELGVPAFTFEVGPSDSTRCGNFFPAFECMDSGNSGRFWPLNLPAFVYATRVARAPYTQPAGPEVSAASLVSDTERIIIKATIESGAERTIQAAELYLNYSPWRGGSAIPLMPLDGSFDSPREQVYGILPTTAISSSTLLLLRGQSVEWGAMRAFWPSEIQISEPEIRPIVWLPVIQKNATP